jgi:penicillin-binding protein 2
MQSLASEKSQSWLSWFLKGLLIFGLIVILGRLIELQVIKGSYFLALAEDNRIRNERIVAPRGSILARGGEILASDQDGNRNYPLRDEAAHITGYMSIVSEEEVGKVDPKCTDKGAFISGSLVGRQGLEEEYRCHLRGIDGERLIEVDTKGEQIRVLGTKNPTPGDNLFTTIDFGLQKKIAAVVKNADIPKEKAAAVVATDSKGEILGFYSSPSFDPLKVNEYLVDPNLPLFNRIISGTYHPGSIFKIITSIAALEEGKITPEYTYNDQGVITINEFSYTNWYFTQYGGREGEISLARALARSTDTYFYKVGEMLGVEALAKWANVFGVGQPTNIDIPGEMVGLVPTPKWKKETKGENWFLGNTYHMSIGQGDLTTTPLEANVITSVIASNGLLCQPHFVAVGGKNYCKKLEINKDYISDVVEGMKGACAPGGTAFPFFEFEPKVACKTGTAETLDEDKTHAWFTVFGPVDSPEPEIVLTILVENGGEGSKVAAPIAKEILQYWFHEREN